jgi:peptidoglycan-associated lipoprotein
MMSVRWQSIVLGLLVGSIALGGAGCKKKPKTGPGMNAEDGTGSIIGENLDDGSMTPPSRAGFDGEGTRGQFSSVYFDYDSALMRGGEESKLQAVAEHLRSNAGAAVLVEGHCDERGSNEYNLSLGDRRAMAVRAALIALGVDGSRVNTKSMGEEAPVAPGHDESSWSQNRRGEFVLY